MNDAMIGNLEYFPILFLPATIFGAGFYFGGSTFDEQTLVFGRILQDAPEINN
jgi:hypothetical protein